MRVGEILGIPSSDGDCHVIMRKISEELGKKDVTCLYKDWNLYVTKGNGNSICLLVSVEGGAKPESKFKVVKMPKSNCWIGYNEYGRQVQIGGNKAGIYIAFKILEKLDNVKIVFTLEKFGSGSTNRYSALYRVDKSFFDNVQCILSLDGEGSRVFSSRAQTFYLASNAFYQIALKVAKEQGFKEVIESYNSMAVCVKDCGVLPSTLGLGIGIQETDTEFEFVEELGVTSAVEFILSLKRSIGNEKFPFDSYE